MHLETRIQLLKQVSGSDWQLLEEGQAQGQQEPRFSTWDDVSNKKKHNDKLQIGGVKDNTYYR